MPYRWIIEIDSNVQEDHERYGSEERYQPQHEPDQFTVAVAPFSQPHRLDHEKLVEANIRSRITTAAGKLINRPSYGRLFAKIANPAPMSTRHARMIF